MNSYYATMTVSELETERTELQAAKLALLKGNRVTSSGHEGGQAEFHRVKVEDIQKEINDITAAIEAKNKGLDPGPRPIHILT